MAVITAETIHIENLRVSGVIGIHPEERVRRQPLVVNVSLEQSFTRAAEHDQIGHTVDYSALSKAIQDYIARSEFQLLETLIRRLAEHLAGHFPIERMSLHIRKPEAIVDADAAAVSLTWARDGGGAS
jgi:dihydroneopterin aldolase